VEFPAGTLVALQTGLRTQAAIAPSDLSVTDLQHLTITLNGQAIPSDQITFQPPTFGDNGQIIVRFTVAGRLVSAADRIQISTPGRKVVLQADADKGQLTINTASTATTLLQDALRAQGSAGTTVPPHAVERVAALLASALISSNTDDPTTSRSLRYALDQLATSIAKGAPAAAIAALTLTEPSQGGGGGGPEIPIEIRQAIANAGPFDATSLASKDGESLGTITIYGTGFVVPGTTVTIAGMAATNVTAIGFQTLTATVPYGIPAGDHSVVVKRADQPAVTVPSSLRIAPYTLATIAMPNRPRAVAVNPKTNRIYVASIDLNTIRVINGATNTVIGSPITVGDRPKGIAINQTTNRIYVANAASNTISVINGATNTVIGTPIPVGSGTEGIAVNPTTNRIYVAHAGDNTVSVIDGATNTVIGTPIPVGANPIGVAVHPTLNRIYVASWQDNTVSVIDGATNTLIGDPIPVAGHPGVLCADPEADRVYAASWSSNTFSVIDCVAAGNHGAGAVESTVAVSTDVNGLALARTYNVYAASNGSSSLNRVNAVPGNPTVGDTYPLADGQGIDNVAINPETRRAYVTSMNARLVTVFMY
jgi:YVTN family beta-propeller protein